MRYINKAILKLFMIALVYCGASGVASACGCGATRSIVISAGDADDTNLYATASFTFSYLCQAEVTAKITAPDSTYTIADSYVVAFSPASVQDSYSIDQTGTYTAAGTFYYDGSDSGLGFGYMPGMSAMAPITKIRAYYQKTGTYGGKNVFGRCNTGSACNTLVSSHPDSFVLLTVYEINIGAGLFCQSLLGSEVTQTMCHSPDPIP